MQFRESLIVAALAATPVLCGDPSVNVYWGQAGDGDLATACESNAFEYITLSFVDLSPENGGPTGYPGTNFAAHCWAEWYTVDGEKSRLLSECKTIQAGITPCQQLGKKVLLSVGGEYNSVSNYTVSSVENGVEFAFFLYGAFGPYLDTWGDEPRPFDDTADGAVIHNAVDGYDFDIESYTAGEVGYVAMIDTLRSLISIAERDDIITGAPQCPLDPDWQPMLHILQNAQFDRLFIQFYNNDGCQILDADGHWNPGFNYAEWEAFLATTPSKNAKLHIGLPGDDSAPGAGYVNSTIVNTVLCEYKDYEMFGGLMFWDQWSATHNIDVENVSYLDSIDLVCSGEQPTPTCTSTTVASTSSSTSTSTVSTRPVTTSSSTTSFSFSSTSSSTTVSETSTSSSKTSSVPSTTSSYNSTSVVSTSTTSSIYSTYSTSTLANSTASRSSETSTWAPVTRTSGTSSLPTLTSTTKSWGNNTWTTSTSPTTSIAEDSTSTTYTTTVYTITACPASVTDCPGKGQLTTETIAVTSSARPVSESSAVVATTSDAPVTTTAPVSWTTSTVYSTTVYTVTSCPPSVTDCPGKGHLTTEIIPVTTTVCPVTESSKAPATTTPPAGLTTSTVYSTTVYTITSCPASVPNCPGKGSVTTETIAVSTTVCPVSAAETAAAPKPTGPSDSASPESLSSLSSLSSTRSESFSTVTVAVRPFSTSTGGSAPAPAPVVAAAGTGTGSVVKPSLAPLVVHNSQPVTAGAGRQAVAVGVPAFFVACALLF